LVRRGAIEPFALDHLPDFSQRETELHVPTATTDSGHLCGGHGRDQWDKRIGRDVLDQGHISIGE
jgi:hypothetical protein